VSETETNSINMNMHITAVTSNTFVALPNILPDIPALPLTSYQWYIHNHCY